MSGCSCTGPECPALEDSREACLAEHRSCMRRCTPDASACLVSEECRSGICVPSEFVTASAARDCAPADGPAWRFTLTATRTSCDAPMEPRLTLSVWRALESEPSGVTYMLGPDLGGDGQASICSSSAPCVAASGTLVVREFMADGIARFDYDIVTESGERFSGTDIEVTRWCTTEPVVCG